MPGFLNWNIGGFKLKKTNFVKWYFIRYKQTGNINSNYLQFKVLFTSSTVNISVPSEFF